MVTLFVLNEEEKETGLPLRQAERSIFFLTGITSIKKFDFMVVYGDHQNQWSSTQLIH